MPSPHHYITTSLHHYITLSVSTDLPPWIWNNTPPRPRLHLHRRPGRSPARVSVPSCLRLDRPGSARSRARRHRRRREAGAGDTPRRAGVEGAETHRRERRMKAGAVGTLEDEVVGEGVATQRSRMVGVGDPWGRLARFPCRRWMPPAARARRRWGWRARGPRRGRDRRRAGVRTATWDRCRSRAGRTRGERVRRRRPRGGSRESWSHATPRIRARTRSRRPRPRGPSAP